MRREKIVVVMVAILLLLPSITAAESAIPFTLRIESIPELIEAGKAFEFEFTVQNKGSDNAEILLEYWIEKDGETVLNGRDSVFVRAGETKTEKAALNILSQMEGIYSFQIELLYNEEKISSYRTIEIKKDTPLVMNLNVGDIGSINAGSQLSFVIGVEFNKYAKETVEFEEEITINGRSVWEKRRNLTVATQTGFTETVDGLEPGRYELSVMAYYGKKFVKELKVFEVMEKEGRALPAGTVQGYLDSAIILIALAIIGMLVSFNFIRNRAKRLEKMKGENPLEEPKIKKRHWLAAVIVLLVVVSVGAYYFVGAEGARQIINERRTVFEAMALDLEAQAPAMGMQAVETIVWMGETGRLQEYINIAGTAIAILGVLLIATSLLLKRRRNMAENFENEATAKNLKNIVAIVIVIAAVAGAALYVMGQEQLQNGFGIMEQLQNASVGFAAMAENVEIPQEIPMPVEPNIVISALGAGAAFGIIALVVLGLYKKSKEE